MVRLLVFLLVVLVVALLHRYVHRRLAARLGLGTRATRALGALLVLGAALLPVVGTIVALGGRHALGPVFFVPVFWLVPFSYLALALFGVDLLAILGRGLRRRRTAAATPAGDSGGDAPAPPVDLGRRRFLARTASGAALASASVVSAHGVGVARGHFETPEIPVRMPRLPKELDGFRIALLSDLHVGPLVGEDLVRDAVRTANARRPDLVAITGDLVDAPLAAIERALAPLGGLESRCGTWFVTGNHEFYTGDLPAILGHLPTLGIEVLDGRCVRIGDRNPSGASFDLAGVADWSRRAPDPAGTDPTAILAGRDPERELVLLAHQPKHIELAARAGVSLQLSGHTHGGQLWPIGTLLARIGNPYLQGLARHDARTSIYVSRGTGYWGIPMRVLVPPEIATIVLVAD